MELQNCQQQIRLKVGETMSGTEIKELIRNKGVKLWEVAAKLGMNDGNFSRRLRKPFNEEEVEHIRGIVERIAAAHANT